MSDLEQPIPERPLLAHGRTWLRPLEERDLAPLMTLVNDRDVGLRAGFTMPFGPDAAKAWLADKLARMGNDRGAFYAVCELGKGDFIGTVWLNHLSLGEHSAELAIAMDADHIGSGWGTEAQEAILALAFGTIGLQRVFLTVDAENARAIRSYEKVGFQHEGRLRSTLLRNGRWGDSLIMSILRDEWLAAHA
jgi:RimJ/RimL family protein N-acetyltransferase